MNTVKFEMQIDSSNSALSEGKEREVGRLLETVRQRVLAGQDGGYLMDYNGNKVGTFSLEIESDGNDEE